MVANMQFASRKSDGLPSNCPMSKYLLTSSNKAASLHVEEESSPPPGMVYNTFFGLVNSNPDPIFSFLRVVAPFFTMTKPGGEKDIKITVVTRGKDVEELFSQHTLLNVPYAKAMVPSVGPFMLASDKCPFHSREKSIMMSLISQGDDMVSTVKEMTSAIAKENIAHGLETKTGEIDIAAHLGRKVAAKIVQRYFGFDAPEEMLLKWSSATHYSFFNNDNSEEDVNRKGIEAGIEMRNYIRDVLIPKRKEALKREPNKQDVVSRLLQTEFTKDTEFDEERIVSNVAGFVVGSIETMNNVICKTMNQLLNKPEAMDMAQKAVDAGDDEGISRICWEALRFDVPVFVKRVVSEDCDINGHHFEKGTVVLLSRRSAVMDPEWIENPMVFNPHRKSDNPMFHFGHGIHTCLGRDVAKIAVPMVIKEIILHGNGMIGRVEGPLGDMKFNQSSDYVESLKVKLGVENVDSGFRSLNVYKAWKTTDVKW
eukprot:CAMPEP_0204617552 /NCGR_PEP_ID=MMETSP0717-20131115/4494_1 /ASSEMBLY_ACC=CAM_ASM_000666 /TAXON_ID=230516 /ORGANISM="Chaetoceros curvisetus" /LENGTH=481 /DNA_ID=CAMNT_0051631113 /DNA_START=711 /DNA_END=2153 /DNA_ORIENTATION=+